MFIRIAEFVGRLFYRVTAYYPRRLPATPDQYRRFKRTLVKSFGVADEPQVWHMVAGQVTSAPPHSVRKPYAHIANAAKRLYINAIAKADSTLACQELNARLEAAVKAESERLAQENASNESQKTEVQSEAQPESKPTQGEDQGPELKKHEKVPEEA